VGEKSRLLSEYEISPAARAAVEMTAQRGLCDEKTDAAFPKEIANWFVTVKCERLRVFLFATKPKNTNMTTKAHWHGIFELALFMTEGAGRVATGRAAGLASFAVPVMIMLLDFIPLVIEPTERLGARDLTGLLVLYTPILVSVLTVQTLIIYALLRFAGTIQHFWTSLCAVNSLSLAPFVFSTMLYILVMLHVHTWQELYPLLLIIEFYGVAITAFALTKLGRIPWELATAGMLFNFLITNHITEFVFSLHGIE
jgi:hypothetical protein